MVRILGFHCRGPSSIPGWGTEIPQVTRCGQKTIGKEGRKEGGREEGRKEGNTTIKKKTGKFKYIKIKTLC